jgi:hypothetical protein
MTSQDVINKEAQNLHKFAWLQNPFTAKFFSELQDKRSKLLIESENLSVQVPMPIEQITIKLHQAHQIRLILDSYAK